MARGGLAALLMLLVLATGAMTSPAALAQPGADGLGFRAGEGGSGGGRGGGLRQWADEYLNLFSGEGRTDQRRPSCRGGECPSGTQCCCCGDRCYCKEECSFQPCLDPGGGR